MILQADATQIPLADKSVDLVFGSPPYEAARTYGIDFKLKGQDWVDWMVLVFQESLRVSRSLVAFVLEGQTRKFRWSATPVLLMADLHRAGVHLRKPPAFKRVGIPGSGGPDWLRNDYEFIVCATSGGKLPWSDNTAMGEPCKYPVGGRMSYRNMDGVRKNKRDGDRSSYTKPQLANPGNVIHLKVGGGVMGSRCHENEAPFPEKLAEWFIRSFCPPEGIILDPFAGSGTTAAVAKQFGRRFVASDLRWSQCELTKRRISEVQLELYQ
jgi:site-specific DNA-methyltransferase (cytosine-N4-specific)